MKKRMERRAMTRRRHFQWWMLLRSWAWGPCSSLWYHFFFSCFQIRIFSLFLSLCSIFSLFLSLYSIPKPLGIRRCFQQKHPTSIHTHKRTKYKVPTNAKKALEWERGESKIISTPTLHLRTQLKWRKVHSSSSAY